MPMVYRGYNCEQCVYVGNSDTPLELPEVIEALKDWKSEWLGKTVGKCSYNCSEVGIVKDIIIVVKNNYGRPYAKVNFFSKDLKIVSKILSMKNLFDIKKYMRECMSSTKHQYQKLLDRVDSYYGQV